MMLDGPTIDALGYGVCIDPDLRRCGLTVTDELRGGAVRRTAEEQRATATENKRRQRARRDPAEVRAANARHQRAKRERERALRI